MRKLSWLVISVLLVMATPVMGASGSDQQKEMQLPKFKKADDDGDGQLTFQEAKDLGVAKKRFKEEDLDNDGKLTKYDYKYGLK